MCINCYSILIFIYFFIISIFHFIFYYFFHIFASGKIAWDFLRWIPRNLLCSGNFRTNFRPILEPLKPIRSLDLSNFRTFWNTSSQSVCDFSPRQFKNPRQNGGLHRPRCRQFAIKTENIAGNVNFRKFGAIL